MKHKSGQQNKVADALNWRVILLVTLINKVTDFQYLKELNIEDKDFVHIWDCCVHHQYAKKIYSYLFYPYVRREILLSCVFIYCILF